MKELFGRVTEHVLAITADRDPEAMLASLEPGSNPIGWLVWHLTRVGDMHVPELLETEQVWVEQDRGLRFGLVWEPIDALGA